MDYRHDKDYYAALGVDPSSPADEIARAYRQLARQHHPDLHPHDPDAEERFKEINEAYTVLSDPEKHAQYDLQRAGSRSSWSPVPSPGPSQDEQPAGPQRYEFARQVDIQWAGEDLEALLQQAANSFAGELRDALREFGEELDSVSRTMRAHVPDRRGRQGFPPPSPPSGRPPGGGRPPGNGRPPQGGKAPKP